ncbi:uncharacterized protein METZ01_LOCUS375808, partial [marine metagenome]
MFLILKIIRPFNLLLGCISVTMVAFLCNLFFSSSFIHTM